MTVFYPRVTHVQPCRCAPATGYRGPFVVARGADRANAHVAASCTPWVEAVEMEPDAVAAAVAARPAHERIARAVRDTYTAADYRRDVLAAERSVTDSSGGPRV